MSIAKAMANSSSVPLYRYWQECPLYPSCAHVEYSLNGGKHAADSTDFQEFMIVPAGARALKKGSGWD